MSRQCKDFHELDERILEVLSVFPKVTFTELAELFPDETWRTLFSAVVRLRNRNEVRLVTLKWDYEITLDERAASA